MQALLVRLSICFSGIADGCGLHWSSADAHPADGAPCSAATNGACLRHEVLQSLFKVDPGCCLMLLTESVSCGGRRVLCERGAAPGGQARLHVRGPSVS